MSMKSESIFFIDVSVSVMPTAGRVSDPIQRSSMPSVGGHLFNSSHSTKIPNTQNDFKDPTVGDRNNPITLSFRILHDRLLSFLLTLYSLLRSDCALHNPKLWKMAQLPKAGPATDEWRPSSPAGQKVAMTVYDFTDQTGQFKYSDCGQTLPHALTQGATSILVKALHETAKWRSGHRTAA